MSSLGTTSLRRPPRPPRPIFRYIYIYIYIFFFSPTAAAAFLSSHRLIDSLAFLFRTASVSASDDVFTWDDVQQAFRTASVSTSDDVFTWDDVVTISKPVQISGATRKTSKSAIALSLESHSEFLPFVFIAEHRTRAVGDVIKSLGEEHGPVPRHGGSVKGLDNEAYGVHMNGAGGLWPTLSITNAIGRDVLFCYDLKLPESFTPKNQDGEVESSNVKAPQALCIHLTRELAIQRIDGGKCMWQNMEVLQKMGKYTGINAKCVVPTKRTSSTSIQSRAPVSAQIVIGTHGTIKKWMSIKKRGVTRLNLSLFLINSVAVRLFSIYF
ncbi:unnamed protein product [Prunus armeniaca]